jgi:hypothetical protein
MAQLLTLDLPRCPELWGADVEGILTTDWTANAPPHKSVLDGGRWTVDSSRQERLTPPVPKQHIEMSDRHFFFFFFFFFKRERDDG